MKKLFFICFSIAGSMCFAQNAFANDGAAGQLYRNKVTVNGSADYKIEGSPFIYENYANGKIEGVEGMYKFRYDALRDEMHILKNGEAFVIAKIPDYGSIVIVDTNETIKLVNYDEKGANVLGYLYLLGTSNDKSLYKKETITLTKEKKAVSSYDSDIPARYQEQPEKYFITAEDGKVVALPTNKKKFVALYPSKEKQLNEYFKKNNVDFNNVMQLKLLLKQL